jgi:hypothetical protein
MFKSFALPAVLALGLLSTPATAAIHCDGAYQLVNGQAISTPYCQDEDLAAKARARNVPVSGATLRNSPETKRQVCVAVSDTACAAYSND